jgi:hypothetical protein
MKNYIVRMWEVYVQTVAIEANSEEEAIEKVVEGEGEYINNSLEYSHALDSDLWTVEERTS